MRVLLIDDHALFRRGLRLMLREVFPAADVSEADSCVQAADLRDQRFDLIFLDWNMPGLQGEQALDAVKLGFPTCPVVVVSGEVTSTAVVVEGGRVGGGAVVGWGGAVVAAVVVASSPRVAAHSTPANSRITSVEPTSTVRSSRRRRRADMPRRGP